MEDLERYDFWHRELDVFIEKQKDDKIILEIIDSSLVNLKLSKSVFDKVMGVNKG